MIVANEFHLVCISIKNAVVVCFAVFREYLVQFFRWFIAISSASLFGHVDATIRHKGTLEWLVGLYTYNLFEAFSVLADVAWAVSRHPRHHFGLHIQDASLGAFFFLKNLQHTPKLVGGVCRFGQKTLVAIVSGVVVLYEFTHVDFIKPFLACEASPFLSHFCSMFV